jgi:hypothetical protein
VAKRDRRNPHIYYAGLENGLYITWDDGAHWYLMGLGLPNAAVYDLAIAERENDLVVGTHGRALWILDDLAPFQQFTPQIAKATAHLFPPPPSLRFWPWSQVESQGDGAFYGANPGYGGQFSYFLEKEVKEPGQLVITDSKGRVVRTMKATHDLDQGEKPPEDEDLPPIAGSESLEEKGTPRAGEEEGKSVQTATSSQVQQQLTPAKASEEEESQGGHAEKAPWVPTKAGLQRLNWDLRADGPVRWEGAKDFMKGPRSGALAPPGEYTATLTIGGQTSAQKLTVVNDPHSHANAVDLETLYQTTQNVLHEISQLDSALNRLDAMQAQVTALRQVVKDSPDEPAVTKALDGFEKQIKAVQGVITSNPGAGESTLRAPDKIHEHLFLLDDLLEGADNPPTPAILEQKVLLEKEYQAAVGKFNQFLQTDAAGLNKALAQHKLTGVVVGEPLQP